MLPFKTPRLLKLLKPSLEWQVAKTSKRSIYLTFDDGPIPGVTEFVLDTLAHYKAKATFFCIGENIKKHPKVFEKVLNAGHSIGNHTYNHLKGSETETSQFLENVAACDHILEQEMGYSPTLFRPPYGRLKESQRKAILKEKRIIMWDVLSQDYNPKISKETCSRKVLQHTTDGSIVLFHDSLKAQANMEYALLNLLESFSEQDYCFQKISE